MKIQNPKSKIQNPYVGPRAFEEKESNLFFGRDEEIEILTGLVMARRVSLFFAESGAGKSSLLRAGLIPELTRRETIGRGRRTRTYQKMHVLPILTVSKGIPGQINEPVANIFVFSALLSLLPQSDPNDLAGLRLSEGVSLFLTAMPGERKAPTAAATLLIFDQFEELFTYYPTRRSERKGFFSQVNDVLANHPGIHVLFSMREDYIARLTPYARLLPEPLQSRFRLERLQYEAALQAVKQPVDQLNRSFADGVAEALVNNLRRRQTSQKSPIADTLVLQAPGGLLGNYIEPVHLQIVCRQLWSNLPPQQTTIYAEDVNEFGDVDQALTDFYEIALQDVIEKTGVSERALRNWFNEHLLTADRTRGLVYRGIEETRELPNQAVDMLNSAYIIRADIRGNDIWYELAHDRLVEPILAANRAWERTYHNPLASARQAWIDAGRAPQKLLTGTLLEDAQLYAQTHPADVTDDEREFLAQGIRQDLAERAQVQRARKRRRNTIITVIGVMLMLILFSLWSLFSAQQAATARDEANNQKNTAQAASTAAIIQRDHAAAAEANAESQKGTAQAASTAAIIQRDHAAAAEANAESQKATAQAVSTAAVVQEEIALSAKETAEAERNSAVEARATLAANLEAMLALPNTATAPSIAPAGANPNLAATATVVALQEQLTSVRATQTAVASICPINVPREFRAVWEQYKDRLGCPTRPNPVEGPFVEQTFENGHMFWSNDSGQFLVTIGEDSGSWVLFNQPTWPADPEAIDCQVNVPPGLFKPVSGFGGLWCTQREIRQAIGFATAKEFKVERGYLLQGFERGIMLRDGNNLFYILFGNDNSYEQLTISN